MLIDLFISHGDSAVVTVCCGGGSDLGGVYVDGKKLGGHKNGRIKEFDRDFQQMMVELPKAK